jgi:mRNA-degrading endonuclease toxin of MazEF toxin-antitoxin module
VACPEPRPGLVVRYAYLWRDEAARGREEGSKDRPCVVVLAVERRAGETTVIVAPVTHTPPREGSGAVEIPTATKRRLGLDERRSWVVTDDLNEFVWPGPDLRPVPGRRPATFAYGLLPAALYEAVRKRVLEHARARAVRPVRRDEAG